MKTLRIISFFLCLSIPGINAFACAFRASTGSDRPDTLTQHGKIRPPVYFILNNGGVEQKSYPSDTSFSYGYIRYATPLTIVGEQDGWCRIIRKCDSGGDTCTAWISKAETVKETDIPLSDNELNEGEFSYDEYPASVNMQVTLIDEAEFNRMKGKEVDFYSSSGKNYKKDGVLRLKIKGGYKEFSDQLQMEDKVYYSYDGEIDELNAYIVQITCGECTGNTWKLVDKSSGEEKGSFPSRPMLTPDKKFLMCIYNTNAAMPGSFAVNKQSDYGVVQYFAVEDSMKMVATKHYPQWAMVGAVKGYWAKDGAYYYVTLPAWANWERMKNLYHKSLEGTTYNYRWVKVSFSGTKIGAGQ